MIVGVTVECLIAGTEVVILKFVKKAVRMENLTTAGRMIGEVIDERSDSSY